MVVDSRPEPLGPAELTWRDWSLKKFGAQRAAVAAGPAVDAMSGIRGELAGPRLLMFRGIWKSFCRGIEFQRAGDEVRAVDELGLGLGLDDLDELAMNLSRKCCSQSAEGMFMFWVGDVACCCYG